MAYLGNQVAPLVQALEGKELKLDSDGDSSIQASTDDTVVFKTNGSNRWTLNSSGNLFPASTSQGIVLGATSDTEANRLDDFEQGDWTVVLKEGANTLTTSSDTNGKYNKIGNMVTVFCTIFNITKSGTGDLTVEGLPFQSSIFSSSAIQFARFTSAGSGVPIARLDENTSVVMLRYLTSGNSNDTAILASNIASSSTSDIRFTLTYRTS